jgi:hypothetical protein
MNDKAVRQWAIQERSCGRWQDVQYVSSTVGPKARRGQRVREIWPVGRGCVTETAKVRDVAKYSVSSTH